MALHILHLEDDSKDAELVQAALDIGGLEPQVRQVSSREAFHQALSGEESFDLILSDYVLPGYNGTTALQDAFQHRPQTPFIFVSGQMGEDIAIESLKLGATDYVVKSRLDRLAPCVRRARQEIEEKSARQRAEKELQESLMQFQATFENAAVGIAHVAPDGRWLRVNEKLCTTLGYQREDLLTKNFADITHPDDLSADWAQARSLLAGEIETYMMRKRYIRKDESLVWSNLTVSLVRTPEGKPDYFISVVEDITERKRAEDDLAQAKEVLEQRVTERTAELVKANEELHTQILERRQLEAAVLEIAEQERRRFGHDLHDGTCQELAAMSMMSGIIAQRVRKKGLKAEADDLDDLTETMTRATMTARDLARGLHPVALDAQGIFSALYELADRTSKTLPCKFEYEMPDTLHENVLALNLYRIAQEAVNNAVKHSGAKSILIRLKAVNRNVTLTVTDNGKGLPPLSENSKGMGLRLMNYRASMIGASFAIESLAQGGTRVTCIAVLNS